MMRVKDRTKRAFRAARGVHGRDEKSGGMVWVGEREIERGAAGGKGGGGGGGGGEGQTEIERENYLFHGVFYRNRQIGWCLAQNGG